MLKPSETTKTGPLRALSNPAFRLLWISEFILMVGRWMDMLVLSWLAFEITKNPFSLSLVSFTRMIPMGIFGPFGGIISDRLPRKKIILFSAGTSLVAAITLGVLCYTETVEFWHILVLALALGIGFSLENPARRSTVYDLVGSQMLVNAFALENLGFSITRIVGPFVGGAIVAAAGADIRSAGISFMVVAVVYLVAFIPLSRLVIPPRLAKASTNSIMRDLSDGLRYVVKQPMIRAVLIITVVWNVLIFPVMFLLPVFAKEVLEVGPLFLGLLQASSGIGQLVGTAVMASLRKVERPGLVFVIGASTFGMATILFALSTVYPLSFFLYVIVGLGQSTYFVLQTSLVLFAASDEMKARALGALTLAIGSGPVGTLVVGSVATGYGAQWAVAGAASIGMVLMLLIIVTTPVLFRFRVEERSPGPAQLDRKPT